jgi:hypothetical protein
MKHNRPDLMPACNDIAKELVERKKSLPMEHGEEEERPERRVEDDEDSELLADEDLSLILPPELTMPLDTVDALRLFLGVVGELGLWGEIDPSIVSNSV